FSKFSKMVESFQGIELARMDDSRVMVRQKVTATKAVSQAATENKQTAEQELPTQETVTQEPKKKTAPKRQARGRKKTVKTPAQSE
ncbi:MAG: hypothetical protein ACI4TB_02645, partial [Lachnospiraceae bacterium]